VSLVNKVSDQTKLESSDPDVISAIDNGELRGRVMKDGALNTIAVVSLDDLERWKSGRAAVSEEGSQPKVAP